MLRKKLGGNLFKGNIINFNNGHTSSTKVDEIDSLKRIMAWNYNKKSSMENTTIEYIVNNKKYKTSHIFRIYSKIIVR